MPFKRLFFTLICLFGFMFFVLDMLTILVKKLFQSVRGEHSRTIRTPIKIVFLLLVSCNSIIATLHYVDFDTSMQRAAYPQIFTDAQTQEKTGIPAEVLWDFFKVLYEKNSFVELQPTVHARIPKIIHQIWIGDGVPEKFKKFQESWRNYHPDWEYRLWTQHDIATMAWDNAELLYASRNPGEMSDIMRYEILYRYGGVYVDVDFECLQPLDELHQLYDFYTGIQPLDSGFLQLGIGLIGSIPGHPLLRAAIDCMPAAYYNPAHAYNAPAKTGPIYFTKIFFMMADDPVLRNVALPAHYCYPLACNQQELLYDEWLALGAFGVHHWAKSWLLPAFRKQEFKDL